MKILNISGLIVCGGLLLGACSSNKNGSDASDSSLMDTMAMDTTTMQSETTESNIDDEGATFMKKAAVGGMMEVEAGKIAATNGSSQGVKDFAAKMVTDHTAANTELMALADKKKIMLPAGLPDAERKHVDNMKKMTGSAFDSHYVDMMITDHAKTVALFKEGAANKDPEVKAFAEKTLKVIEEHYEMAKKLKANK